MSEWLDISTAPKDQTHLLLATRKEVYTAINFNSKRVFAGYFQTQANDWIIDGTWAGDIKPTHWMPLPEPPKDETCAGAEPDAAERGRG